MNFLYLRIRSLQLKQHSGGCVQHPAGKFKLLSQLVQVRPKADTLHDALDLYPSANWL